MRRPATWLVVGGLVVLGAIAAIETFVGDEDATAERTNARVATAAASTSDDELPERLQAAGARGLLYMTVHDGEGCELRAIRLPSLIVESAFPVPDCRFAVAPNGSVASGSDCRVTSALATFDGAVVDLYDGCAPAWKPTGDLTFVRHGSVMVVPRSCPATIDECARVILPGEQIRRAFAELDRDPPAREIVREIAWLDDSRLGAIVRRIVGTGDLRRTIDFVIVFEGSRFLGPLRFGRQRLTDLAVDRPGRRFLVSGDVVQGVFELDDRGRFVDTFTLPQGIPEVSSVAVSPDGSWGAAAGRATVVLFERGERSGRAFQLPFEAEALAWRGP